MAGRVGTYCSDVLLAAFAVAPDNFAIAETFGDKTYLAVLVAAHSCNMFKVTAVTGDAIARAHVRIVARERMM